MKRLLWLVLLVAGAAPLNAQDTLIVSFPGGEVRLPATVALTPCPECPECPPPIICPPPVVCPECPPIPEWECPEGWTCTPPPEPEGPVWARSTANTYPQSDTLQLGTALPLERVYLWLDMEPDTLIRRVLNTVGGVSEGTEQVFPYALKGDGGNPHVLYGWLVPDSLAGPVEIRAVIQYKDATTPYDTIIGVIEIENPNVPPDTVPPVIPPDTVPPPPEDTTLILFGWRSDMGRWLGSTLKDDSLPPGDYVFFLELRNRESWDGVDSVVIGLADQTTFITPREHVPMDGNDGTVTFEPDKFYLLPYVVWGEPANEHGVIEGRKANVHVGPDLTGELIPLDAPENLRIEMDTLETWALGPTPVVRWDPSPQRSQGTQCEAPEWGTEDHCRPVNDPHISGDEVYSLLRVYDLAGAEIGMACDPFGNCVVDPEPFQNLVAWGHAIPTPDTIRACVRFEAWDCDGCIGPGGQIPPVENEWGNMTRGVPLSETTCANLEVR